MEHNTHARIFLSILKFSSLLMQNSGSWADLRESFWTQIHLVSTIQTFLQPYGYVQENNIFNAKQISNWMLKSFPSQFKFLRMIVKLYIIKVELSQLLSELVCNSSHASLSENGLLDILQRRHSRYICLFFCVRCLLIQSV